MGFIYFTRVLKKPGQVGFGLSFQNTLEREGIPVLKPLRLISEDPSVALGPKPLSNDSFAEPCKAGTILTTKVRQLLLITCSKCPGKDLNLDLSDAKPETLLQTKPLYFFSLSFPICKIGRFGHQQVTSGIPHCHAG